VLVFDMFRTCNNGDADVETVHAFGRVFDVDVTWRGDGLAVTISPDGGGAIRRAIRPDETMGVVL
jgi:hypothetical protein